MQYHIIRGTKQIGGTITEIVSDSGAKLWIDFGMELSVKDPYVTDEVAMKKMQEDPPAAVLFTHIHGDHIGLLHAIPKGVNIYLGPIAIKMLINIRKTLLAFDDLESDEREKLQKEMDILNDTSRIFLYKDGMPMDVEGIKVTPFEVDHSVADAYMLRFEENGRCILHTGDFRTHGRKGEGFIHKIKNEIASVPVNVLITEGTMMSRGKEHLLTEVQMQKKAQEIFEKNKYAFLVCSSTNIESLASFYWAMIQAGKKTDKKPPLIVNSYVKKQLELFTDTIGKDDWRFRFHRSYSIRDSLNLKLSNGKTQKQQMIDEGFVMMVGTSDYYKELMEQFREYNPVLIYSLWDGYLDGTKEYANPELIELVNSWSNNVKHLHTSGHASPKVIAQVIEAVNPSEAIVPVHTENAEGFRNLPIQDQLKERMKTNA